MKSEELLQQVGELIEEAKRQAEDPDLRTIDEVALKLTALMASVNQRYVAHEMEAVKFKITAKDIQEIVRSLRKWHDTLLEEKKSTR